MKLVVAVIHRSLSVAMENVSRLNGFVMDQMTAVICQMKTVKNVSHPLEVRYIILNSSN